MKKYFFLSLMVFLMADNVWSKPILEIATYQGKELSRGRSSAMNVDVQFIGFVNDLKESIKKSYPEATNIETQLYVDSGGFVVVGDGESVPVEAQRGDLVVKGRLFVKGEIWNPYPSQKSYDELKTEISALKDKMAEMTDLKREIAELKAEIRVLRE